MDLPLSKTYFMFSFGVSEFEMEQQCCTFKGLAEGENRLSTYRCRYERTLGYWVDEQLHAPLCGFISHCLLEPTLD